LAIAGSNWWPNWLAVRPYCHTNDYWQVYFDTNKTIAEKLGAAGFQLATRQSRFTRSNGIAAILDRYSL
jgi:hypothetical protein